jgi:hypothetical protein
MAEQKSESLSDAWDDAGKRAYAVSVARGLWAHPRCDGDELQLIESLIKSAELAIFSGNRPHWKHPQFKEADMLLAAAMLRLMELSVVRGWKAADAAEVLLGEREQLTNNLPKNLAVILA